MKAKSSALLLVCAVFVAAIPGNGAGAESAATNGPVATSDGSRLKWNRETLAGDIRQGHRNPKWDDAAKEALEIFARMRCEKHLDEPLMNRLVPSVESAVTNGCDDPMILYLYLRFAHAPADLAFPVYAEKMSSMADAMCRSDYSPMRKFYAALRTMSAYGAVRNVGSVGSVARWREQARNYLIQAATNTNTPVVEVAEGWDLLLQGSASQPKEYDLCYFKVAPLVFSNWPAEPDLLVLKGRFYTDYAWEARGSGYVETVTREGASAFIERLGVAEAALMKAWGLNPRDPRIARWMLTVELGQGQGRPRMEKWFNTAMRLDTNYYDACYAKLHYLQPQWYGSQDEMLEFAAECLNSTNWGGHVPLVVLDVHRLIANSFSRSERDDYFRRPDVWSDLKQAFDKFFRLNPRETGWHHDYAHYAYVAEQWDDLNRELKLLGKVNYAYFGGKDEFEKMVSAAKEHAMKTPK